LVSRSKSPHADSHHVDRSTLEAAAEGKLRFERRGGELLAKMEKNVGAR
jgi:hypothetical protein